MCSLEIKEEVKQGPTDPKLSMKQKLQEGKFPDSFPFKTY